MERRVRENFGNKLIAYSEELESLTRQKYGIGLRDYIMQKLQQNMPLTLIARELEQKDYGKFYRCVRKLFKIKIGQVCPPIKKEIKTLEDLADLNIKENASCLYSVDSHNWQAIERKIMQEYNMSLPLYLFFQHQFNDKSIKSLSLEFGFDCNTLRNAIISLGIPIKDYRGRNKRNYNLKYDYLMGKYWGNGLSLTEIAKELGVSKQAVSYRMKVFEIPIRNKSEAISLAKSDKFYSIPSSIRGKTYEEFYGEKRAREIKEKISAHFKGKTYEELYGLERAKEIRTKISQKNSGKMPWNKGLTKKDPRILKLLLSRGNTSGMKGKHHSKETRTKMSESHKRWWANKKALNNI